MSVMKMVKGFSRLTVFRIVPPFDGGWSLTPMESLLRGLRNREDMVSMELYGVEGVVSYSVRSRNGDGLGGMLHSYFPQARVTRFDSDGSGDYAESNTDWLFLHRDEFALVQTLHLDKESYLPLRIFDDASIENAKMDPLAGVIGLLDSSTRPGGECAGDRFGLRVLMKPAAEDWNKPWRDRIQDRRDGEDRPARPVSGPPGAGSGGSGIGSLVGLGALGGIAALGWWLWTNGNPMLAMISVLALSLVGILAFFLFSRFGKRRGRTYIDERLVEDKLKSLGFNVEVQLVRIYRNMMNELLARNNLEVMIDCMRAFDDPVGNSWRLGALRQYSGVEIVERQHRNPFVGGSLCLSWLNPTAAGRSVLSAREVASVWHLPLGKDEMASMDRTSAGMLMPFLADLAEINEDSGPLVGIAGLLNQEIRLPESSLEKHSLVVGRSGVGKSTFIKHVLAHKLQRKGRGEDNGAIMVVDPHADLVRDVLSMVPPSIAHKVRLLDFGRTDRVPGINLVDPYLFPDRDRCVDTIIVTVKSLWEHWGGRLEDLLKRSLLIVYEFNAHPDTEPDQMLTMLDILKLLDDSKQVGQGREQQTVMSDYQKFVLSRVTDSKLHEWFKGYLGWSRDTRAEALGPVHSRIGAYAADQRASVIMGQRRSTILLSDVLEEGLVLLVSTAKGTVGEGPAALMGGTMVSLLESALRSQESLETSKRSKCLLICDEFQTVLGANWEGMLAEIRKYGCSLMLATQSLARLDTGERRLKDGVLGNVGCIVGYQMSAADSRILASEMDEERVEPRFLVNLDPHSCYVRINSATKCYQTFMMKTLPPPEILLGSKESEAAVLAGLKEYTVDWQEAREKMNAESWRNMGEERVGVGGSSVFVAAEGDPSKSLDAAAGGGSGSGAGDQVASVGSQIYSDAKAVADRAAVNGQRFTEGALKNIPRRALEQSVMSPELLEALAKVPSNDPGLRALEDKRLGDKMASEQRKLERRFNVRVEEAATEMADRRVLELLGEGGAPAASDLEVAGEATEVAGPLAEEPLAEEPLAEEPLVEEAVGIERLDIQFNEAGGVRDLSRMRRPAHLDGGSG